MHGRQTRMRPFRLQSIPSTSLEGMIGQSDYFAPHEPENGDMQFQGGTAGKCAYFFRLT